MSAVVTKLLLLVLAMKSKYGKKKAIEEAVRHIIFLKKITGEWHIFSHRDTVV